MQQTKIDGWLRRKFAYRTQVLSHRLPEGLSRSVKSKGKLKKVKPRYLNDFSYSMVFESEKYAQQYIDILNSQSMVFSSNVIQKKGFFAKSLCNKGRSFLWHSVWRVVIILFWFAIIAILITILRNPSVIRAIQEAMGELQRITS